ncbi:hypothetical protein BC629DRAFT_645556 [Irpex lacteus]|nr:hypothetical protein BC629DRAFT_645556 [Irpex lacteus]
MAYEQGWGDYLYAYWKEYFHADSSIFPDDLVEALGRLIVGQGSNKPHHLRQLEERRQQSKSTEDSDVGVQSDDEGKDIPGRPSTGVGNTDQEDSANNKTMEIYDTREGLVGLALGDERSVGLEGVTGTEDTHADFAEALIDHGAAPSVSSSHDVATSVLADTKDKISDAPNEEANVNETAASGAPAILGHVAPHEESSGSGQESLTENGEGSALTDQEVARNDVN